MANPMKPEPTMLDLKGDQYGLLFDLNAFAAIEDEYPTTQAAFQAMEDGSLKALRTVLTAAMNSARPQTLGDPFTVEHVGALVDLENMKQVTGTLTEVLTKHMPEAAKKKAAEQKKAGGQGNVPKPDQG